LARLFEEKFAPYPQRWRTSSSAPIVSAQKIQLPTQSKQVNPTIAPVDSKPPLLPTPPKTSLCQNCHQQKSNFGGSITFVSLVMQNLAQVINVQPSNTLLSNLWRKCLQNLSSKLKILIPLPQNPRISVS